MLRLKLNRVRGRYIFYLFSIVIKSKRGENYLTFRDQSQLFETILHSTSDCLYKPPCTDELVNYLVS